jgi:UDP-N-acetylmuramate--alanine ligase
VTDAGAGEREGVGVIDLQALAREAPVHFVGVAGAGMASLAELVLRQGGRVSGCDVQPGEVGARLESMGARIIQGHDPAHVSDVAAVVATAAVPMDHPELEAARRRGIPVLKRAAALGLLVNRGTVIAVAGTHGKTTTTAMIAAILEEAGLDPTAFVGGIVPAWHSGLKPGSDTLFVVEADEYDRSFLALRPTVAVVTAVEADHLDVFGTLEAVEAAFDRFIEPLPPGGALVACIDDPGARRLLERRADPDRSLPYGLGPRAELRATTFDVRGSGSRAVVALRGQELGELTLAVPGVHNLRNAVGALGAALHVGATFDVAARALGRYRGVARRFQLLGDAGGITVVDDYAHHPTEIAATLAAARAAFPGRRLVAVFQPHLYSRTRDFAGELGAALSKADVVWVTDVYPAREAPLAGVTGELVADSAAAAAAPELHYVADPGRLAEAVLESLRPGDVALFLGAGSITSIAHDVRARLGTEAER